MSAVRILFSMPGSETRGNHLARRLAAEAGGLETRRFPVGETYPRIVSTDAVAHASNAVPLAGLLARALQA